MFLLIALLASVTLTTHYSLLSTASSGLGPNTSPTFPMLRLFIYRTDCKSSLSANYSLLWYLFALPSRFLVLHLYLFALPSCFFALHLRFFTLHSHFFTLHLHFFALQSHFFAGNCNFLLLTITSALFVHHP